MRQKNRISQLFNIKYPIIQGGMVWASGWKLASAVSNCGGLGLIGAGSMKPELLEEHILRCRTATNNSFGVNIPLLRGDAEELIETVIHNGVKIVFTSAGHPGKFIDKLKSADCKVVHVVPAVKFAKKVESVGCDAVVAEGIEAGGHNGADEITTFALIPQVTDAVTIPVIAAGGIATGRQIAAAFALGAEGVQIGTLFASSIESSLHENYKKKVIEAEDNSTTLIFKNLGMARVIKSPYSDKVREAEQRCASIEELKELLGRKKEMTGMFNGDFENGMMEAGQGAGLIKEILPIEKIFEELISDFDKATKSLIL